MHEFGERNAVCELKPNNTTNKRKRVPIHTLSFHVEHIFLLEFTQSFHAYVHCVFRVIACPECLFTGQIFSRCATKEKVELLCDSDTVHVILMIAKI